MSRDQYLYRIRRPSPEELQFASKRYVHDCGLTPMDAEEHPIQYEEMERLGLVATARTYHEDTDEELIRRDFGIPENAKVKGVAMRQDHVEYTWSDADGKRYHAVIGQWEMEHRYTTIGSETTGLIHSERIGEWNDKYRFFEMREDGNVPVSGTCEEAKRVHEIAKRHIGEIANTAWHVCPTGMLAELVDAGLVDADEIREGETYAYEEWW